MRWRRRFEATGEDREFIGLAASGRTDTGVHARGQVVHFYTREPFQDLARGAESSAHPPEGHPA